MLDLGDRAGEASDSLIRDRYSKFTAIFDEVFCAEGIRIGAHRPSGAPHERDHGTLVRQRALRVPRWMFIIDAALMRKVLSVYESHFNGTGRVGY
jgi:putative transposase